MRNISISESVRKSRDSQTFPARYGSRADIIAANREGKDTSLDRDKRLLTEGFAIENRIRDIEEDRTV